MLLHLEDMVMRQNYDFAPLFGSTVGFDTVFDLLQSAANSEPQNDKYPPYDIERTGADAYRITLAVAGFTEADLTLTAERNQLLVEGRRAAANGNEQREFLHRGIGARPFRQQFQLADHVKVVGANLSDGLLTIELVREVPEVLKPRRIEIERKTGWSGAQPIEAQRAAA
jgi:molecular chaperone IbpA